LNQHEVESGDVNGPPQSDDLLEDRPREINQINNYSEAEEEGFVHGFEPTSEAEEGDFFHGFEEISNPVSHLRRSLRPPKPTEAYSRYRGYHATATDHEKSTVPPNKKTYGKLNTTLSAALSSPEGALWKAAVEDELTSLKKNGTWELVPLPPGRKPIKSKWILELKPGYDGVSERYKARLVALGCSQRAGLD
jgi:hypothetical protein